MKKKNYQFYNDAFFCPENSFMTSVGAVDLMVYNMFLQFNQLEIECKYNRGSTFGDLYVFCNYSEI